METNPAFLAFAAEFNVTEYQLRKHDFNVSQLLTALKFPNLNRLVTDNGTAVRDLLKVKMWGKLGREWKKKGNKEHQGADVDTKASVTSSSPLNINHIHNYLKPIEGVPANTQLPTGTGQLGFIMYVPPASLLYLANNRPHIVRIPKKRALPQTMHLLVSSSM